MTTAASSAITTKQIQVPKGRNVSGRPWKTAAQRPAVSLIKTEVNNQKKSWEKKLAEKIARKNILELQKQMEAERKEKIQQKKERRLENERRRAENEYKTIQRSAQTLNTSKVGITLKALSKKQLRQIKKTRVNPKTGVVEYVSAYAK
jgi:ADP-ribosylglycohydrolase